MKVKIYCSVSHLFEELHCSQMLYITNIHHVFQQMPLILYRKPYRAINIFVKIKGEKPLLGSNSDLDLTHATLVLYYLILH